MKFALSIFHHLYGQIYKTTSRTVIIPQSNPTSLLIVEILLSNRFVRILSNIKMTEVNRNIPKLQKNQHSTRKSFYSHYFSFFTTCREK